MTKFKLALFVGVATLSLAKLATSASAITMQAVYTGTVSNGFETANDFGLGLNTAFNGNAYSLTFNYDTATPTALHSTVPGLFDSILGGTNYGPGIATPIISATLLINSVSKSVGGLYQGRTLTTPFGGYIQHAALNINDNGVLGNNSSLSQLVFASGIPANLETPFTTSTFSAVIGSFSFSGLDPLSGLAFQSSSGNLNPLSLTITRGVDVSPIPLPAALPLFGLGLGALGLVGRARRKKAV